MKTRQINEKLQVQKQVPTDWQQVVDVQTALIEERDDQISTLHKEMTEVHDLFEEIALTIEDQGELIDNIQKNVEHAAKRVEDGKNEIEKANENMNSCCCPII